MKITPQLVQFGIGFANEAVVLLGESGAIKPNVATAISGISQLLLQAIEAEVQTPIAQAPQAQIQHSLIEGN